MKRMSARCMAFGLAIILTLTVSYSAQPRAQQPASQTAAPQSPSIEPRRDAHVIMISIDGLIPEYYTAPARLGLKVPNLTQMKLGGAYADGVEGVFPTVTYPAHTTLITGVSPAP